MRKSKKRRSETGLLFFSLFFLFSKNSSNTSSFLKAESKEETENNTSLASQKLVEAIWEQSLHIQKSKLQMSLKCKIKGYAALFLFFFSLIIKARTSFLKRKGSRKGDGKC